MNESQKRVVKAMQQFFENFRKKQVADAGKKAPGNRKHQTEYRRLKNGINRRATTEI